MRHDQDRSAAGFRRDEGRDEELLALMVESRIGLVEEKRRRIAEQGARESQALSLPVAELRVVRAGPGRLATGKPADDLMQSGRSRRRDHRLGRGAMKTRDRIGHGSVRELLALRHVADETTGGGAIRLQAGDGSRPLRRREHAGSEPKHGGFPAAVRAGQHHELARGHGQADAIDNRPAVTVLRPKDHVAQHDAGSVGRNALGFGSDLAKEGAQPTPGQARCHRRPPRGEQLVEGAQEQGKHEVGTDKESGGRLTAHHEEGGERDHAALRQRPQQPREGGKPLAPRQG